MWVSGLKAEDLTSEIVDKLLFHGLADTGEDGDCVIVLGSIKASRYRVPVAAELYRTGRAKKVLLSGGAVRDFPYGRATEAEDMHRTAVALGIPEEDLILEESSQNTVENILCSLLALQRVYMLNNVKKVILVTTAYHMRRSYAIARYLFPAHISIVPCPADDTNTRRDNWMNSSAGEERAKSEAMNIVRYIQNGVIPDFEI